MPAQFTLPPDTRAVGSGNPPADMNAVVDALTATGATFNVLSAAFSGGADPTGAADSAPAFAAAMAAAATAATTTPAPVSGAPAVFVPPGNYLLNSPVSITGPVRFYGAGPGSRIFTSSSGIFDFGNTFLTHVEIDHLTLDATGGHIFTNFNLRRSSFHHLVLIQRGGGFSIGTLGATGTALATTDFDTIVQYVFPDPSTGLRSVPAWNLLDGTAPGKNLDVLTFRKVTSFNQANATGSFDNTQFIFDIACTVAGTGGLADRITFQNCDFGQPLGGCIRARSVQGLLIEQLGVGNIFTQGTPSHSIGNSMIFTGQYPGAAVSEGPVITGYVRENSGTVTFGSFSDIEVDAATVNTTITGPVGTGALTNPAIKINLNGSLGAQVINAPSNVAISNPGTDTIQVGNGLVKSGTRQLAPMTAAAVTQPANPAVTASTTLVMMGCAVAYTPTGSGKVAVTVTGSVFTNTAAVFGNYGGRYGTGTAPVNGAAVTGTRFGAGADPNFRAPSAGSTVPAGFALTDVITGLTPGTAYWFDLALSTSAAADTAQAQNLSFTLMEVA